MAAIYLFIEEQSVVSSVVPSHFVGSRLYTFSCTRHMHYYSKNWGQ